MSTTKSELDLELESYDIAKLRKYAAVNRVSLSRDMDKQEIIEAIKAKNRNKDFIHLADAGKAPNPGYARIILQRDPTPGAANRPVYVQVNGYRCTVPRGVEVDVPIKVVNVLNDAREQRLEEDQLEPANSSKRWKSTFVHSYPYQVLQVTPGPDPSPGNFRSREAAYGPRVAYRDKYGRWPKRAELMEAIKEGIIKQGKHTPKPEESETEE